MLTFGIMQVLPEFLQVEAFAKLNNAIGKVDLIFIHTLLFICLGFILILHSTPAYAGIGVML